MKDKVVQFPRTLIIIPCFNEQDNIGKVVDEIFQTQPNAEIAVINDCSNDATSAAANQNAKRVIVLDLPVNLGVGGAVQTGFKFAIENNFNQAIKLDGDGQHPPQLIFEMLQPIKNGLADIVIGSRFISENRGYKSSYSRRIGIKLLQWLSYCLTGIKITDPTSGFRAYSNKALKFMAEHYPTFDYPEPEEIVLAAKNGLRILEIPVEMRERLHGTSTISSSGSIYYMLKVTLAMFFVFLRPAVQATEE